MKAAMISFTEKGAGQALLLKQAYETITKESSDRVTVEVSCKMSREMPKQLQRQGVRAVECPLSEWTKNQFETAQLLIFVGAAGIAVRSIAPYVASKVTDPAVLVTDEAGEFLIPILSGHLGGANEWARQLAQITHSTPVITTASDVNGKIAIDVFAAKNRCLITDMTMAKRVAAEIVADRPVCFSTDAKGFPVQALPAGFVTDKEAAEYGVYVGLNDVGRKHPDTQKTLWLIPRALHVGIGCKKNKGKEEIERAVQQALEVVSLPIGAVCALHTIDLKKDEPGLVAFAKQYSLPLYTYPAEQLKRIEGSKSPSAFVESVTGVDNVCERAALCGCKGGELLLTKQVFDGVTVAIGVEEWRIEFE